MNSLRTLTAGWVGLGTACYAGKLLADAYPDRVVTSPILEEMLRAGGADHASALRFWISKGKGAKPEPNPAVAAIIARHRTGDCAMDEAARVRSSARNEPR